MKAWSLFYPDVLPELPGAPLPLLDHWLRNTAIEFCERTRALVVNLAAIDAVALQMAYPLVLPANTELVEIIDAWFSGQKITAKSGAFLNNKFTKWADETGTPDYYTQEDTANVLLVPAPAAAEVGAIVIKAALKPGIAATGIDDWLYSKYRMALCAGVKSKMMDQANVAWANPDRVAINLAQFESAIETATTAAADSLVRSRPRFSGSFC